MGPITKFQLFNLLCLKSSLYGAPRLTINGISGILCGIAREDGSGSSFNVTIDTGANGVQTVYVRTID